MQLRVLGCSGGIGGNLRTTSMLVDHDVLIDAGTGVGRSHAVRSQADRPYLRHALAPGSRRVHPVPGRYRGLACALRPVTVHATRETLDILKAHLFNWKIWPDFTQIPSAQAPYLRYEEIRVGEPVRLGRTHRHRVAGEPRGAGGGFQLDSGDASLVFTGDTTTNDALWEVVNRIENLRYLIIETAFSDAERQARHRLQAPVPRHAGRRAGQSSRGRRVCSSPHLKPGEGAQTMEEVEQDRWRLQPAHAVQRAGVQVLMGPHAKDVLDRSAGSAAALVPEVGCGGDRSCVEVRVTRPRL